MDNKLGNTTSNGGVKRTIVQTALLMAILTLVSKLLGFVREMVIAGFFGTSYIVDAYVMAQSIPTILFGGVLASIGIAYMPTFSDIVEKKGKEAGNKFTNEILNLAFVIALVFFAFGFTFAEQLVNIVARDFEPKTAELTTFYLRIAFGYMLFSCGASMLDAYMQYRGKYLAPIIAGYFQNLGIIVVAIISALTSHYYLAIGIILGYGLRFLFIFLFARKNDYMYKPKIAFNDQVKQVVTLAIPVFVSTAITSFNTFVDKALASSLQEGSISALNYGMMIVTLITGLTTAIVATIIYPKITKAVSTEEWDFFNLAVEKGMTIVIIIGVPFGLGVVAFAQEVVQIIYERGAFDAVATALTGSSFLFYGMGLVFMALNTLLTQVYYSMRDVKTPIICAAVSVAINICFNLILIRSMAHNGLALATSIAAFAMFIMLYILLVRKYKQVRIFKSKRKLIKIIISASIAVAVAVGVHMALTTFIWMPRLIYLSVAVLVAVLVYIMLLVLFNVDEVKMLKEIKGRVN